MGNKTEFYNKYVLSTIDNGWNATHDLFLVNGRITYPATALDKMWGQLWWCIWLALHPNRDEALAYTIKFLDGTDLMLKRTGGIFLRDSSDDAYFNTYVKNNNTEVEASKDQSTNFISGLYMLYTSFSHEVIRERIRNIARVLNDNLASHWWFLYNDKEKRMYNSPNYCQVHYWGMSNALDVILGKTRNHSPIELILSIIGSVIARANVDMMWGTKQKKYWWQNIEKLKKYPWYGDYFRAGMYDFNLNLVFGEMLVVGSETKDGAEKVLDILDSQAAKDCRNLNFSALYLYLRKRWRISGLSYRWHKDYIEKWDEILYPNSVIPNETRIGSVWNRWGILNSHEIYTEDYLNSIMGTPGPGTMEDLINVSKTKPVECSNGLHYISRLYLREES